jgi:hypothetical protein
VVLRLVTVERAPSSLRHLLSCSCIVIRPTVKPLAIGYLHCAGWPLLMLDLVSVRVGDRCGWLGERDRRRFGGRNDGDAVIR